MGLWGASPGFYMGPGLEKAPRVAIAETKGAGRGSWLLKKAQQGKEGGLFQAFLFKARPVEFPMLPSD